MSLPGDRVRCVRVKGQRCGAHDCQSGHVYKVELPHRLRLFCLAHAQEYVDLARELTGLPLRLELEESS